MSGTTATTDQGPGMGSPSPRLDSWKEVAAYLRRSPRTVRRWERQEGLPVQRHLHGKQSTVYAFAREIDAWLKGRSLGETPNPSPAPLVQAPSPLPQSDTERKATSNRPIMLAILPLRNLSGNPEQERFADGLTEELISEIGYVNPRILRVIALTSVMQYKHTTKSIGEIGRELCVDFILEGGIRRYGRRVRLTARLISARDQANVWADTYEIQLPPVFLLQQALAHQVANSLSAELHVTPCEMRRRAIPRNVAAHDAYLEANSHFLPAEGDIKKCIEHLSLAVERDPKYAPGYADLALAHFRLGFLWDYPPVSTFRRIEELALMALKLDSGLSRARTASALFNLFGAWKWSKAEASSRRAIEINPSDAWAWIIGGACKLVTGEPQEAIEDLQQARQIAPRSREMDMVFVVFAYLARRYDVVIELGRQMLRLDPSLTLVHLVIGSAYALAGENALALSHCEKAGELGCGPTVHTAMACSIYAAAGQSGAAERLLRELVAASEQQYLRYYFLAVASAGLGNDQQTLEWLEMAYEQREPLFVFLKTNPRFDPLSGLPRFHDLLRRIGLPSATPQIESSSRLPSK